MKKRFICFFMVVIILVTVGCSDFEEENNLSISNNVFQFEDYLNGVAIAKYYGEEEIVYIPSQYNGKNIVCIKEDAFYQCDSIKYIFFPDSLQIIETNAFYRCYLLQEVYITKNICFIGDNPFFRCISLLKITVDKGNLWFESFDGVLYDKNVTEIIAYPEAKRDKRYVLPDSVKTIRINTFGYHSPYLRELIIPENVVNIPSAPLTAYPWDMKLVVKSGSEGEIYAKNYQYQYELY